MNEITKLYGDFAALNHAGMFTLRAGLVVVLLWIGGLKVAKYKHAAKHLLRRSREVIRKTRNSAQQTLDT